MQVKMVCSKCGGSMHEIIDACNDNVVVVCTQCGSSRAIFLYSCNSKMVDDVIEVDDNV